MKSEKQRFWEKVDIKKEDECWLWYGCGGTYGSFRRSKKHKSKMEGAHRMAFMLSNNLTKIPNGMYVCHSCDNPKCCNPNHLFLGTPQDNIDDMFEKKRNPSSMLLKTSANQKGEKNNGAKLTEDVVRKIKIAHKKGISQAELMRKFNVTRGNIWAIVHEKSWKHIVV